MGTNHAPIIAALCVVLVAGSTYGVMFGEKASPRTAEPFVASEAELEKIAATIEMNGDDCSIDGTGAFFSDGTLTVSNGGTYLLKGSLDDGTIAVDAGNKASVILRLDGVSVENDDGPALATSAGKVLLELEDGTENRFVSGEATDVLSGNSEPDESAYGGAITAKNDLTVDGTGTLVVEGYLNNALHCSDNLFVENGKIEATALNNAVKGKESLTVDGGEISATAGNDGLKSDDEKTGEITLNDGNISIVSLGDGGYATNAVRISGGTLDVETNGETKAKTEEFGGGFGGFQPSGDGGTRPERPGGNDFQGFQGFRGGDETESEVDGTEDESSTNGEAPSSNDFPNFGNEKAPNFGNGNPPENGDGFRPDGNEFNFGEKPETTTETEDETKSATESLSDDVPTNFASPPANFDENANDSTKKSEERTEEIGEKKAKSESSNDDATTDETKSSKGIKAGRLVEINGGTTSISASDDAIHSDDSFVMTDGDVEASSSDDGVHAEETLKIDGGTLTVTESYEGIEGKKIEVNGGEISVKASDDGFNATDGSGGGFGSSNSNSADDLPSLTITGGTVRVDAAGDGLDSNGDLTVSGGDVVVDGPTSDGNGVLDSGSENGGKLTTNGGVLIALGSAAMAEIPDEESLNRTIAASIDFSAGDVLSVEDEDGNELASHEAVRAGAFFLLSSTELEDGRKYVVKKNGEEVETVELNGSTSGSGSSGGTMSFGSPTNGFGGRPDFGNGKPDETEAESEPETKP